MNLYAYCRIRVAVMHAMELQASKLGLSLKNDGLGIIVDIIILTTGSAYWARQVDPRVQLRRSLCLCRVHVPTRYVRVDLAPPPACKNQSSRKSSVVCASSRMALFERLS